MNRSFFLALAATVALTGTALAAPTSVRLRGTVTGITSHTLMIKTTAGTAKTVMLTPGTHYLKVEKSSLAKIDPHSYIGTATKTVGHRLIALEVVVFPPAMRGVGEGHYPWDRLPDTTKPGDHTTKTMMTNGTVTAATPTVSTMMTNGTVAATTATGADKRLTVTYKGGQQTILVPPTAPIVTFAPGTKAIAVKGGHVFIKATESAGTITAQAVAVGVDGVTPPM